MLNTVIEAVAFDAQVWFSRVGGVLGIILGLAASQPGSAFILLLTYSIGLGIPFLIVGAFTPEAAKLIGRLGNRVGVVTKNFGLVLVGFGILVFTNTLSRFANFDYLVKILR